MAACFRKKAGYPQTCEILLFVLSAFIFSRCYAFVFFEGADEIAQVIESVPIGDICDGIVGGGQLAAGLFDPLTVQIIHRRLVGHLGKEPAEVFRRHGY